MTRVLVIDDEASISWALDKALSREGYEVATAATSEAGLAAARSQSPDVILLDVRLPGEDRITALERFRQILPETPVVIMTAFGSLETAVDAIHHGALEYLTKPFDLDQVVDVVRQAIAARPASRAGKELGDQRNSLLIGSSLPMQAVFRKIALVAEQEVPVLICGESGTGKELVAKSLHRYGRRANGPFVPICVPAFSESIIESELFGHASGAFTGATGERTGLLVQANNGIAFFDEIGDISLATQVKLLRVLESREVLPVGSNRPVPANFKLVAATNRNLEEMIRAGTFREDLYYRLNVFRIDLPPLRDRGDDILLLANHFLAAIGTEDRRFELSESARAELMQRRWHGNVRELRNTVEHAAILSRSGRIEPEALPPPMEGFASSSESVSTLSSAIISWLDALSTEAIQEGKTYERFLREAEPILFKRAIEWSRGNRQEAARLLGIHRQTLREKLRRYDLDAGEN